MATSSSKELLTIQCGHYANHVGTHWWNLQEAGLWHPPLQKSDQEEINSDCMFREGITLTGRETYTPRVIAIDLSGSLNSLKEDGILYTIQQSSNGGTWKGPVDTMATEPNVKNEFIKDLEDVDKGTIEEEKMIEKNYNLDSSVKVWSDFLRPHLHPKSLMVVPGFFHDDDRFNAWPSGIQTWNNKEFLIDIEDRLHFFLEECDKFQGVQLIFDQQNGGFSALASSLIEYLHDDLPNKSVIAIGVTPPPSNEAITTPHPFNQQILNSLLTIPAMYEYCSLLMPLSLSPTLWPMPTTPLHTPSLNYTPHLFYHSSAILSIAMETFTSCYRSSMINDTITSICGLLGNNGRKISSMSLALPINLPSPSNLSLDSLQTIYKTMFSLTPHTDNNTVLPWEQSLAIRGYQSNRSSDPSTQGPVLSSDPYSKLIHHLYTVYPSTNSQLTVFNKPLITNNPFPAITEFQEPTKSYRTVSCCTVAQTHSGIHNILDTLVDHSQRCNPRLVPSYYGSCIDNDIHSELTSNLISFKDNYAVGPRSECSTDDEN